MKRKIAVSVPEELVARVEREVHAGRAASVSAYVSEALAEKAKVDDLVAALDEMDREFGKPAKEADEWARRVLGLS
ncbi:MAG: ribbon-helix-helix domain-containing protein [Actinomycetota bacterium]|nr:ribbon-helix-helix domain-containing protein [Actinomycetota bacterium]